MAKILVVDDDKDLRETLVQFLEIFDHSVDQAINGKNALEIFKENKYDCIISDIQMPVMNGIEFLENLKKIDKIVPVILLTGVKDLSIAIDSMKLGAHDYLVKPFELDVMKGSIAKALYIRDLKLSNIKLAEENRIYQKNLESLIHKRTIQLEEAVYGSLAILAQSVELKDPYTRGHSERVRAISMDIGRELGLPSTELDILSYGSILHDIGKIGIKDDVLLKEGKLTQEEYNYIMSHPQIGADLVKEIKFFEPVIGCIRFHHEKYNGEGYPQGLKGEDIPLLARIISVADTFDAMTSTRPYRKALSIEKAVSILIDLKNSQLDGYIVDIFVDRKIYLNNYSDIGKTNTIIQNSAELKSLLRKSHDFETFSIKPHKPINYDVLE
ncbi:MAG: response regulator [Candidatus Delongbacteria bacterium]|nr:response regulator [Candidatus Delongbacteria bacterium]MBN2835337.1 response regulator [Candidatus Delongbacteria bacterium]